MNTVASGSDDDGELSGIPEVEITGPRFAMMPEELLYDPEVSPLAKVIYGVLRRHGETPPTCYPSRERIGSLVGVSARSVQRPIVELEAAGWVDRQRRFAPDGRELTTGYAVHGSLDDRASERAHDRASERDRGRAPERDITRAKRTRANTQTRDLGDRGFDDFWSGYPSRRGRKVGKSKCLDRWRKLSLDDRRAAWRGAVNYAAEIGDFAKDPERWLRDRLWEDWQGRPEPRAGLMPGATPFYPPSMFEGNHVYEDGAE